ncbi:MAG: aminotransferase class IV [Phaeodactylibacter sp.]|nr:aminotransferase class IV [Phaeodactylibacter sp.]MCB9050079.1 aminotransferase class IV [Lewinellaceae bacterium]
MKGLLLETIRCERGELQNLEWHQERAGRSCRALFGTAGSVDLQQIVVPREADQGLFKCRVLYDTRIRKAEFTPYAIRPVRKLMLIRADKLEYTYKLANRTEIQNFFARRGTADDILLVKNGCITDTSYANIALFDGSSWYTPSNPLLEGTRRASLLAAGILSPAKIPPHTLGDFQEIRLINAMMGLEEGPRFHPQDIIQIT